jgi:ABC-type antimicrobial peptide transport system permease subunit
MLAILYLVVGFGILGTVIMMTIERKKEFGIMIAVGMQKKKLMGILAIETILITLLGIISGALTSIPILFYMKNHPIPLRGEAAEAMLEMNWSPVIPFIVEPGFFINQSIAVLLISLIIIVYPLKAINKLKIVNAIKGR